MCEQTGTVEGAQGQIQNMVRAGESLSVIILYLLKVQNSAYHGALYLLIFVPAQSTKQCYWFLLPCRRAAPIWFWENCHGARGLTRGLGLG